MMKNSTRAPIRYDRLIWGLAVVSVGVLCWLEQQERIDQRQLLDLWPGLLAVIGLCYLVDRERPDGRAWGLFLLLAGGLLLAGNLLPSNHTMEIRLGWLGFRISWPLLLVVFGIYVIGRDRIAGEPAQEEKP